MSNRNREIVCFKATPVNESEPHWFEAEYEEISEGIWQKIPGTEKDLGPVNKK